MKLYYKDEYVRLFQGDCLEVMDRLIEKRIKFDAIITDPPYGTTKCRWDSVIPLNQMWNKLDKITNINNPIVIFSSQPFTSELIHSNLNWFKYEWIWEKTLASGQLNAKIMPMKIHENICIFGKGKITYIPQMEEGTPYRIKRNITTEDCYGEQKPHEKINEGERYPKSIIKKSNPRIKNGHPTQKPLELIEYLINTYTKENELILDFTCGSGTTLLASRNLKRRCIGIELEEKYCEIAKQRLEEF